MSEHVTDESDYVEASERFGVAFIVLDQAAAASGPREGSFYDPTSRQQDEAAFCLRQFDDLGSRQE